MCADSCEAWPVTVSRPWDIQLIALIWSLDNTDSYHRDINSACNFSIENSPHVIFIMPIKLQLPFIKLD